MMITPNFGRQLNKETEWPALREKLLSIAPIPSAVTLNLTPDMCFITPLKTFNRSEILLKLWLLVGMIRDKLRCDKAAKHGATEQPTLSIQWVRTRQPASDTWEISNPCKGNTCPVRKNGQPATGRATNGQDMISWTYFEPDTAVE